MFQIGDRVQSIIIDKNKYPGDMIGTIVGFEGDECLVRWGDSVIRLWHHVSYLCLVGDKYYNDFQERIEERLL